MHIYTLIMYEIRYKVKTIYTIINKYNNIKCKEESLHFSAICTAFYVAYDVEVPHVVSLCE